MNIIHREMITRESLKEMICAEIKEKKDRIELIIKCIINLEDWRFCEKHIIEIKTCQAEIRTFEWVLDKLEIKK